MGVCSSGTMNMVHYPATWLWSCVQGVTLWSSKIKVCMIVYTCWSKMSGWKTHMQQVTANMTTRSILWTTFCYLWKFESKQWKKFFLLMSSTSTNQQTLCRHTYAEFFNNWVGDTTWHMGEISDNLWSKYPWLWLLTDVKHLGTSLLNLWNSFHLGITWTEKSFVVTQGVLLS